MREENGTKGHDVRSMLMTTVQDGNPVDPDQNDFSPGETLARKDEPGEAGREGEPRSEQSGRDAISPFEALIKEV